MELETFHQIKTGPTRGANQLDKIFVNIGGSAPRAVVVPPLETEEGLPSDHSGIVVRIPFEKTKGFKWIKKTMRKRTEQGTAAYLEELADIHWGDLEALEDVDEMVRKFEETTARLTDKHFPLKTVRMRDNEHPWITDGIRAKWKKKMRIFKKYGRGAAWKRFDARLTQHIMDKKREFVEKVVSDGNNGKSFHAAIKKLTRPGKAPWNVTDLFPGKDEAQASEEILRYFSEVGGKEEPTPAAEPDAVPFDIEPLSHSDITDIIRKAKIGDSRVYGDPLPHTIRQGPHVYAPPVAIIFNRILSTGTWPKGWKQEHLTILPKVSNPGNLGECRNNSCTALLSKLLEGVVQKKLREELTEDPRQFGGIKGSSVDHMLIDLWDKVLGALDDGSSAVAIAGIDFEKAFNRMEYSVCLDQLNRLGASQGSRRLIWSFLHGRTMAIKLGQYSSKPVALRRGSPQGSVLGCILFCIATQMIAGDGEFTERQERVGRLVRGPPVPPSPDDHLGVGLPTERERIRFFPGDESSSDEEDINFWDHSEEDLGEGEQGEISFQGEQIYTFKYIDDTTFIIRTDLDAAIRHFTTGKTIEEIDLAHLEDFLEGVRRRAHDAGMKINTGKTQLLVIGTNNGCRTTGSLRLEGNTIEAQNSLKLVGFHFCEEPNAAAHIAAIKAKFRARIWMLFHLKWAGMDEIHLYKIYCCYIRSVIEFCSPTYHALLSKGQSEDLEKMHRYAVRVCFGADRGTAHTFAVWGIETLEARRIRRFDTFIRKTAANPKYREWFPRREADQHNLRNRDSYLTTRTKTQRYYNSPLLYMRRRLNFLEH